ncbi:MAG: TonB-dependent receptor [Crocinitomicaceae bacterium]|nr:TonB-dependent receptor [Crocinitomicaceae bacterium]
MIRFILLFFILPFIGLGQVTGLIQGQNGEKLKPLYGAKVKLLSSKSGVITEEDGQFELVLPRLLPDTLVISARGYFSDTIPVTKDDRFTAFNIVLFSQQLLPEVIVDYRKKTTSISRLKVLHVEELTSAELRKAACCNLSESFETNASVDVNMTDAVSGAKKIQMMGLEGIYTQIQFENIPYLRGIESSFGLETIPGTWIESIQITKGTGNVVNGYESMAGLINLEFQKPDEMERIFVNAYQNRLGRSELNFHSGIALSDKWSTGIFGFVTSQWNSVDENNDGFRDLPIGKGFALNNRWSFEGENMEAKFGVNAHLDEKLGGQMNTEFNNSNEDYGVLLQNEHIDFYTKTGFFGKSPGQSFGIVSNWKYQKLNGYFGNRNFYGLEKRGYLNLIYDDIIKTTDHKIKLGASYTYIDILQLVDSIDNSRIEHIPGVFGEYTYTGSRITSVLGVRYDYHLLFGQQFVPRAHLKYKISPRTDLRLTSGKGWRVPNYLIDNVSLLANSFSWIPNTEIVPEVSWNLGGSVFQEFQIFDNEASITVDYYRTWFENQLVVDREYDIIRFQNQKNESFSNSLQAELSVEPINNLTLRMAYKYLDVKARYGGEIQNKVMIPSHRGFMNAGYQTRNKRWEFDMTLSIFGKARLAASSNSTQEFSDVFPKLNAQVTHRLKKWEFYLGGENLTNYKQENPIVEPENPFGSSFDATRAWGPIIGYNLYFGIRFAIIKSKQENEE